MLTLSAAAAVPVAQRRVDAHRGGPGAYQEGLYLWTGPHVKRLFPGFENLAADVYWIRTVQYFGGRHAFSQDREFALLEPLTDITVTLDPRFDIAYRYGAVFMAEPQPVGAGRPASGVALLERGARENPLNWRLRKELGYFYFVFLQDAKTAARVLLEAAEVPGAADWLRTMAADLMGRGGDRETARRMWRQMYDEEEGGALKTNALTHLRVLDALDGRDRLQAVVDRFRGARGRAPSSLEELGGAGMLASPPIDPAGTPYAYDARTGQVGVSPRSPLWRADR